MKLTRKRLQVVLLLMTVAAVFSSTWIANAGRAILGVHIENCQIVFTFEMPPDSDYEQAKIMSMARRAPPTYTVDVRLYDEGVLLQQQTITEGVGLSVTVYFPITQFYLGEDVGVGVWEQNTNNFILGTGDFEVLDAVAEPCIPIDAECPYPPAPLLGQGRVIGPVTTYFAPSLTAETIPPVVLPVGTSWWILEARDGFYKLFIACEGRYVWVTAESLGANFDTVWNGAPLPDAGTRESQND